MRESPERLAWAVLLISFSICIGLGVAVPLSARFFMLSAREGQNVTLEVQRGPLRVRLAGRGEPVAIAEERDEIPERTVIATDSTAGRLVMHTPGNDRTVVAAVQLYDNTEVELLSARSPRFSPSRLPHEVELRVEAGRVRVGVSSDDKPTIVEVHTPHGTATLAEGSYEVKVNATTEVTVRYGQADLTSGELSLRLEPAERAVIGDGQITGPLTSARNLIENGDLQAPLENGWTRYREQTDPNQPPGSISIVTDESRRVVSFERIGSNHAEVAIRQEIDYDVRDFSSLELRLGVRILHQDIAGFGGCGYLGSECPIIVLLKYKDIYGTDREWLHGFYTGEPASDWLINWWTEEIPQGNWQTYDSGNLMEELDETPPALVKSLTIYASGHSFHAMVTEIELLAQE